MSDRENPTTNKRDWMFGATGSGKTSFDEFRKMFPSPILFELRPRKAGVMEQSLRDLFASDEDYEHYCACARKTRMEWWMDNPFLVMAITLAAIIGLGLTGAVFISLIAGLTG